MKLPNGTSSEPSDERSIELTIDTTSKMVSSASMKAGSTAPVALAMSSSVMLRPRSDSTGSGVVTMSMIGWMGAVTSWIFSNSGATTLLM